MAEVTINTDTPAGGTPPVVRALSVGKSLAIAVIGGVIAAGATVMILRNEYSTAIDALLAAVALAAFGVTAYGLIQAVLAVIDSAGERRRHDRIISERRQGERARQPRE